MLSPKSFGANILDEYGELDRYELSEIIYNDDKKRNELNNITLPYIVKKIKDEIESQKDKEVIIIDAPLLFESGLNEICNITIGVISEKELQIKRIIDRDYITENQARKRIESQNSNEFYREHCDEIIENNNDLAYIKQAIYNIAQKHNITKRLQ